MLDGSVPLPLMESLTLSLIGIFIVFLELTLLAGMIMIISKVIRKFAEKDTAPKSNTVAVATNAPAPATTTPVATAPHGVKLEDIDEPTAATVMAVVSHQTGIPLNRLDFHSIKGVINLNDVNERDAAVIMATVAQKLNKPVNKLIFKSITQVN